MSRRGAYIGGHTVFRPSPAEPDGSHLLPRAKAEADKQLAAEEEQRQSILDELVFLSGRIFEIEREVRAGEISVADASTSLDAMEPETRLSELDEWRGRINAHFHPQYGPAGTRRHVDWLRSQLDSPGPDFFRQRSSKQVLTESKTPLEIVEAELKSGLFGTPVRNYGFRTAELRIRLHVGGAIKSLGAGQRLEASLVNLLEECERRHRDGDWTKAQMTSQRAALEVVRMAYIEHLSWVGRGRQFSWTV